MFGFFSAGRVKPYNLESVMTKTMKAQEKADAAAATATRAVNSAEEAHNDAVADLDELKGAASRKKTMIVRLPHTLAKAQSAVNDTKQTLTNAQSTAAATMLAAKAAGTAVTAVTAATKAATKAATLITNSEPKSAATTLAIKAVGTVAKAAETAANAATKAATLVTKNATANGQTAKRRPFTLKQSPLLLRNAAAAAAAAEAKSQKKAENEGAAAAKPKSWMAWAGTLAESPFKAIGYTAKEVLIALLFAGGTIGYAVFNVKVGLPAFFAWLVTFSLLAYVASTSLKTVPILGTLLSFPGMIILSAIIYLVVLLRGG